MILPFPTPEPVFLFLDKVPPELHAAARACFEAGDGRGFAEKAESDALQLIDMDADALIERGIYEEALLQAWVGKGAHHPWWRPKAIAELLKIANREKLLAAGSPLPPATAFNVFRGVAGRDFWRRELGFSWTLDRDVACWYALRDAVDEPAVMSATITRAHVLAFCDRRGEREIITYPAHARDTCEDVRMTLAAIHAGAERWASTRPKAEPAE